MTSQPRVSIGIPVYNGQAFVADAIDSVLAQTYGDFEILLSDNASSDRTEEICMSYVAQDDRVRYIRTSVNQGANRNFRRVAEAARGDYFKWLASDDYLAPEFIDVCLQSFRQRQDAVVVTTLMPYVDEDREPLPYMQGERVYLSADGDSHRWLDPPPGLEDPRPSRRFEALILGALFNVAAQSFYGLIDQRALKAVRPHGLFVGADKVLVSELALRGAIVHLPIPLMFRRFHGTNLGSRPLAEYAQHLSPTNRGGRLSGRLRHACGYALGILKAEIGWPEKVRSLRHLFRKIALQARLLET